MSCLIVLDLDGTLIPGNAPNKDCGPDFTPFDPSSTCVTRDSFQRSIATLLNAGSRAGHCYIVTAANRDWIDLIEQCYSPLGRVISVYRDTGEPDEWKEAAFTKLVQQHGATQIVVIGDRADSEIAAGRRVAKKHGIQIRELLIQDPATNCEAVTRNHRTITDFLQRL